MSFPQFDTTSFPSSIFWSVFSAVLFYLGIRFFVLPFAERARSLRDKCVAKNDADVISNIATLNTLKMNREEDMVLAKKKAREILESASMDARKIIEQGDLETQRLISDIRMKSEVKKEEWLVFHNRELHNSLFRNAFLFLEKMMKVDSDMLLRVLKGHN